MINLKWIISMTIIKLKNANVVTRIWMNWEWMILIEHIRKDKEKINHTLIWINDGKKLFSHHFKLYCVLAQFYHFFQKSEKIFFNLRNFFLSKKNFEKKILTYSEKFSVFFYQNNIICIYINYINIYNIVHINLIIYKFILYYII